MIMFQVVVSIEGAGNLRDIILYLAERTFYNPKTKTTGRVPILVSGKNKKTKPPILYFTTEQEAQVATNHYLTHVHKDRPGWTLRSASPSAVRIDVPSDAVATLKEI